MLLATIGCYLLEFVTSSSRCCPLMQLGQCTDQLVNAVQGRQEAQVRKVPLAILTCTFMAQRFQQYCPAHHGGWWRLCGSCLLYRPFVTSTKRFPASSCGINTIPGPGSYDSSSFKASCSAGVKGYGPFASSSNRLASRVTYTGPGPGV